MTDGSASGPVSDDPRVAAVHEEPGGKGLAHSSLTDREYWREYWSGKEGLAETVSRSIIFHDLFESCLANANVRTAIELGGFPGRYLAFLARFFEVDVTLLDFVADQTLLRRLEEANRLAPGTIRLVEGDLFTWEPQQKYDLVYSVGLIEHFPDTDAIIRHHVRLLNEGGVLLIIIPNLRGVNGLFQRVFDRHNFEAHYLGCMDPAYLREICAHAGLRDVRGGYHLRFGLWIQKPHDRSLWVRTATSTANLVGRAAFRFGPRTSRLGSPFIYVTGRC